MTLLDKLDYAKNLPPGHYGIREAEEAVKREYAKVRDVERSLYRKIRDYEITSLQDAADFCGALCYRLGSKPIRRVVSNSRSIWNYRVGGHYNSQKREIHLPGRYFCVSILIHETTHHIMYVEGYKGPAHGEQYIEILRMLYEIAEAVLREGR